MAKGGHDHKTLWVNSTPYFLMLPMQKKLYMHQKIVLDGWKFIPLTYTENLRPIFTNVFLPHCIRRLSLVIQYATLTPEKYRRRTIDCVEKTILRMYGQLLLILPLFHIYFSFLFSFVFLFFNFILIMVSNTRTHTKFMNSYRIE